MPRWGFGDLRLSSGLGEISALGAIANANTPQKIPEFWAVYQP